ncbi:MAG TPA: hypothetical protein VFO48_10690, partial [Vicinamibacterales bacterium]|nr:hypothetical protein [Vicinamibacterales bacterium]
QQRPAAQSAGQRDTPSSARGENGMEPTAGRGEGAGGRRGGRGNFQERMANMTPEERERFMERMRARGMTVPAEGQTAAAASGGRGQGPRTQAAAPPQAQRQTARPAAATTPQNATTFDALFGPLPQTETFGQVWLNKENKLQRIRLRLGITDGQQTELIQALDGELQEGTEVVTNVLTGSVRQVATPQGGAGFPGLTGGRQGFPGGGNRGGGGRGGG